MVGGYGLASSYFRNVKCRRDLIYQRASKNKTTRPTRKEALMLRHRSHFPAYSSRRPAIKEELDRTEVDLTWMHDYEKEKTSNVLSESSALQPSYPP